MKYYNLTQRSANFPGQVVLQKCGKQVVFMLALPCFVVTVCLPGLARPSPGFEQLANAEFRPHLIYKTTDNWFYLGFLVFVYGIACSTQTVGLICCRTDVLIVNLAQRLPVYELAEKGGGTVCVCYFETFGTLADCLSKRILVAHVTF